MGSVATVFKVYPEPGNEDAAKKEIEAKLKPKGIQVEEIAFGIKVIKVLFVHDDKEGSTELEEKLRKVKGIIIYI
ncbi:elongation factor 1-beta [Candidatus Marsarchaeota archaeon]|nr:elongation factor 1-beta [Candidatus Marsarchaeota archaeon]